MPYYMHVYRRPCTLCFYTFWSKNTGSPEILYAHFYAFMRKSKVKIFDLAISKANLH